MSGSCNSPSPEPFSHTSRETDASGAAYLCREAASLPPFDHQSNTHLTHLSNHANSTHDLKPENHLVPLSKDLAALACRRPDRWEQLPWQPYLLQVQT